jgi:RNA-binding protein Musashi
MMSEPKIEDIFVVPTNPSAPTIPPASTIQRAPQKKEELPTRKSEPTVQLNTDENEKDRNKQTKKDKSNMMALKLKLGLAQPMKEDVMPTLSKKKIPKTSEMRLFVGHLCTLTDETALKEYFSTFGDVVDVFFPRDSCGGTRGFAFVTFSHLYGEHPMKTPRHVIKGREVYLDVSHYKQGEGEPSQTLLVSGIITDSSDETITNHFSNYGKVIIVIRPKESRKKHSRYAFVHFDNCKSVEKALADPIHIIDGHTIDLRRARDFHYYQERGSERPTSEPISIPNKQAPVKPLPVNNQCVDVKKLLIHNLDLLTTTDTIRRYFSQFGTVLDAYIPTVYGTNDSKGFGYIVMPSNEANFCFSNHVINDRVLHITNEGMHNSHEKSKTLLVSAGPEVMAKVSEQDLRTFFSKFGKITSVRKPSDSFSKKTSHYAFVEFTSYDAVEKALECMSYKINNQIVCITKSRHEPHK